MQKRVKTPSWGKRLPLEGRSGKESALAGHRDVFFLFWVPFGVEALLYYIIF